MAMRTKSVLILTAGALAVAGGVGIYFLNHPNEKRNTGSVQRDDSPPLQIADAPETLTTELGFTGQRDFAFENLRDNPVTVGVEWKDCQCARVEICRSPEAWETLEQEGKGFEVPPRGAGILRLHWKGNKPGDHRFWASLWIDDNDHRLYQRIEVSVQIVPAVLIRAEDHLRRTTVDIGRLN